MEMVSAAKMRKAQQRVTASRPYSEQLRQIMSDLAAQQPDPEQLAQFPLLQKRPVQNVELIVVTPDRGLTGALNTNILRRATRFILDELPLRWRASQGAVQVIAVGKKARDYFVRTRQDVVAEFIGIGDNTTLDAVRPIADIAIDDFASGKVDAVYVVYSRFVNTLVQRPEVLQILPVEPPPAHEGYSDYIFEPSPEAVLNDLLPRYVEVQLYQAILEGTRLRALGADGGHAQRLRQRQGDPAGADALVQQGASGADHQRGFRDRGRRQRDGRLGQTRARRHHDRRTDPARRDADCRGRRVRKREQGRLERPAPSCRSPARWSTCNSRRTCCRRSTTRST